ncbi:LysR family transcriptional regulator [Thalassomonas actiniarum]|uniref:LysR family transcriptional regulator n=1 Tax=Thalassomonas actiniarum TaxID=485447 RepID=A0AAE9YTV7_9GAMM|nr:LysR family transcriptional regulator [Thalassomonas actiniarum]WDE00319.1 LysR family transcriptional regulator [Thalassomonas actiniarum]
MEFYHLRSFVLVAKTGNLTLAAKHLYTTPPAVSAHIKALEQELKTALFTRTSKGMQLTEKGRLLLTKAEKTLDSALEMVNLAAEHQNEIIANFRLGINQPPGPLNINQLLDNLKENCPGISLDIQSKSSGEIIAALSAGTLDGGYLYGEIPEDLSAITVKQQQITTITPVNSTLAAGAPVAALCSQPWITMGNNCPFDHFLQQKLSSDVIANIKSSDDGSRLELVKMGHGLSFLEKEQAQLHAQKREITLLPQLDFTLDLYFAVAKARINEPVIKAMLQELRILWQTAL